jgi:hypothetical protein
VSPLCRAAVYVLVSSVWNARDVCVCRDQLNLLRDAIRSLKSGTASSVTALSPQPRGAGVSHATDSSTASTASTGGARGGSGAPSVTTADDGRGSPRTASVAAADGPTFAAVAGSALLSPTLGAAMPAVASEVTGAFVRQMLANGDLVALEAKFRELTFGTHRMPMLPFFLFTAAANRKVSRCCAAVAVPARHHTGGGVDDRPRVAQFARR